MHLISVPPVDFIDVNSTARGVGAKANAMLLQGLSSSRPTRSMPSEETRMLLV